MIRILLSPILVILTVILIPSVEEALVFLPLIFTLSVSVVNWSKFKYKFRNWGILLSVIQSYVVFMGLAIVTFFSDELLQGFSLTGKDDFGLIGIILVTLGGYLASLLLFFFSTYLFRVADKKFGYYSISICYVLIVVVMQAFSKNEFLQFGVEKFASFLVSWVIFMSLGYSLALNKNSYYLIVGKGG